MLRHTILLSSVVVAVVVVMTMTGEISPLTKVVGWATTPTTDDAVMVAETSALDAANGVSASRGRQVTLEADSAGHFQGNFRINGRTMNAMVDTGATVVAMNLSTAQRAGVRLAKSEFRHEVQTANGRAKAAQTMIETVEIGRIRIHDVEAIVLEDGSLNGVLVGMSFLRRLKRYEAENHRLLMVQ